MNTKNSFVLQLSYDPTASLEEAAYICWYSEELSSISLNICLLCSVDRIPPISSDCSGMGCTLLDPKIYQIIQFKMTSKPVPVLTYKQLTPIPAKKWFWKILVHFDYDSININPQNPNIHLLWFFSHHKHQIKIISS